jgi:hypothetical protein
MNSLLKNKGHRAGLIVVFAIAAFLGPAEGYAKAEPAEVKSECVACHTDVKNLVRLSSEIEKIRPESRKSAETAGEG